jgi:glycosyltransferase involved in cell wall biosynthesis
MKETFNGKVLFITHDATRTGAPTVLLQFLQWVRANKAIEFDVLLRRDGPLVADFEAVANTCFRWVSEPPRHPFAMRAWHAFLRRVGAVVPTHREMFVRQLVARDYSLIYGNTVVVCDVMRVLMERTGVQGILHVHEMEGAIRWGVSDTDLRWVLANANKVISVSEPVTRNLCERHGVMASRLAQIPECVPDVSLAAEAGRSIRQKLGISLSSFVVGGSGTFAFRKGPDLLVQVAKRVVDLLPKQDVRFVWVGGDNESTRFLLAEDVRKLGLGDRVVLTGSVPNPLDYFQAFDLFLITSREDPFPLVCLENAQCGNPIVCFADAIGSTEYIDETCGHVSPFLDLDDMARAVAAFANDPDKRRRASVEISRRVAAYTTGKIAPRIAACIREVIDASEMG